MPRSELARPPDGTQIVPRYLTARDHPWLECLIQEYARFAGRRRIELDHHLETPLPVSAPPNKLRLARQVLDREYGDRIEAALPPRRVRRAAFLARATHETRAEALARAAEALALPEHTILELLFADLHAERRLVPPAIAPTAAELALEINHAMICGLLKRATAVTLRAEGEARALVRAIKLRGLLCVARSDPESGQLLLDISGPLSLFRRTLVYGRALASLLPRIARSTHFELTASCVLPGSSDLKSLVIRSGDPIIPAGPLAKYDSKVEERFARDLLRATDDWDLVREPEPVPVAGHFAFPDFLIRHRRAPRRRAWLEIVGFWTPEYLSQKLDRLRHAQLDNFILCIDEQRNCSEEMLPVHARLIRYRKRVPAAAVLELLETMECA